MQLFPRIDQPGLHREKLVGQRPWFGVQVTNHNHRVPGLPVQLDEPAEVPGLARPVAQVRRVALRGVRGVHVTVHDGNGTRARVQHGDGDGLPHIPVAAEHRTWPAVDGEPVQKRRLDGHLGQDGQPGPRENPGVEQTLVRVLGGARRRQVLPVLHTPDLLQRNHVVVLFAFALATGQKLLCYRRQRGMARQLIGNCSEPLLAVLGHVLQPPRVERQELYGVCGIFVGHLTLPCLACSDPLVPSLFLSLSTYYYSLFLSYLHVFLFFFPEAERANFLEDSNKPKTNQTKTKTSQTRQTKNEPRNIINPQHKHKHKHKTWRV